MERQTGLEPATPGLEGQYSTNWATAARAPTTKKDTISIWFATQTYCIKNRIVGMFFSA